MSSNVASIDQGRDKQVKGLTVTLGQLLDAVGEGAPGLPPNGPLSRTYALIFPADKAQLRTQFRRLMRDVLQEVETFRPVQMEIFQRHGTPSSDGQILQITSQSVNWKAFQTELSAARSVEITLSHEQMPELTQVWAVSPVEEEALTWLVGEIQG